MGYKINEGNVSGTKKGLNKSNNKIATPIKLILKL